MNNTRNEHGLKDSCNMYRTINGIEFEHWMTEGHMDDKNEYVITIKMLRKENPEYKFIKRGCEIFRSKEKLC